MPEIRSRNAVESALPSLLIAPNTTKSSALHKVMYTGPLSPWQTFEASVRASMLIKWSSAVVDYQLRDRDLRAEEVYVADETGVQGRFDQSVGQVLGSVFRAQGVNIRFADFKSAGTGYTKVPDVALVSQNPPLPLKAVGELKVPWVPEHAMEFRFFDENLFRRTIGQVVEYMVDQGMPYAFHSTYEETIMLRQVMVNNVWTIQYSPAIDSDAIDISTKQCFWYLASVAAAAARIYPPQHKDQLFKFW
ncbi:uncharacterized protein N7518_005669 [Penicillium psychrosexuale]|uniref:uncharacterized protein n=1 Tax=Penicillium psychrosexuale TaxID=1002107 RepID=UPI002545671B|nr:uncharacterized protein N7518_005669 [Penicillium psychrosexuale]KAJ5797129.1 hypothetical protein N7518_005669 [Penicillium psychrosexuale]